MSLNHAVIRGLADQEAEIARQKHGWNILPAKDKISWPVIFLSQFKSPLVYILLFASSISLVFKEYTDLILILVVVVVNAFLGFYQEYSAQKTLRVLNQILQPKVIAIRSGRRKEIEAKELVPGDIVVVGSGDKIPADGVIIEGNILVAETILTGESEAVEKSAIEESPLFMGTLVLSGLGLMLVEKIGLSTKIGAISKSLQEIKATKTPLQEKLERFSRSLAIIIVIVCVFIFISGTVIRGYNIWEMLRIAIVLSVAAIPEGLPIATTMIMVLGMRRILKKRGLVKKLLSIETLGSASVICADKTGTLTEGVMKVVKTDFRDVQKALLVLILNNNQRSNLEVALWDFAQKQNGEAQSIFDNSSRILHEPFDSLKKYSLTLAEVNGQQISLMMGAPDVIINFCSQEEKQEAITQQIESWSQEGFRLLGLAYKSEGDLKDKTNMQWLGLVAIEDPVRANAHQALLEAQSAGLKFKIITGDYRATAEKTAQKLDMGIKYENIMEGNELEKLSVDELKNRIDDVIVFSRTTPLQKLKIVDALQQKGEIVAMTGDGVNDAPALKKSDIGVVMANGAEVAKETGDLILLDNDFQVIVSAIEEGRLVFSNIKKVVGYVLSNSFAEIMLIFGSILLGLPAPITIVQILWIHLICDGPPDIMLAFEPKERNILNKRPEKIRQEDILSGPIKFLILAISLVVGISALAIFHHIYNQHQDIIEARTMAFATIASVSLIYIFSYKNLQKPLWRTEHFFQNKYLLLSVLYGYALLGVAVYVPLFNRILGIRPLHFFDCVLVFSVGFLSLIIVETVKYLSQESRNS